MQLEKPKVVQFKNDSSKLFVKKLEMISRAELGRRWGVSIVTIKRWTERSFDPLPMEKTTATEVGKKEVVRIPFELALEWKERNTSKNYEVRA